MAGRLGRSCVVRAIGLAAVAFAGAFAANTHLCPIFNWAPSPCDWHINVPVFTLIAGGVPPLAAAIAALAGDLICRRTRPTG